jgi:hypothetical protein
LDLCERVLANLKRMEELLQLEQMSKVPKSIIIEIEKRQKRDIALLEHSAKVKKTLRTMAAVEYHKPNTRLGKQPSFAKKSKTPFSRDNSEAISEVFNQYLFHFPLVILIVQHFRQRKSCLLQHPPWSLNLHQCKLFFRLQKCHLTPTWPFCLFLCR